VVLICDCDACASPCLPLRTDGGGEGGERREGYANRGGRQPEGIASRVLAAHGRLGDVVAPTRGAEGGEEVAHALILGELLGGRIVGEGLAEEGLTTLLVFLLLVLLEVALGLLIGVDLGGGEGGGTGGWEAPSQNRERVKELLWTGNAHECAISSSSRGEMPGQQGALLLGAKQ